MSRLPLFSVWCAFVLGLTLTSVLLGRDASAQAKSGTDDAMFVQKAAEINLGEVKLGTLASEKAANSDVRQYGQMLAADHSKANEELKAVAGKLGISLPNKTDQKHEQIEAKLAQLQGAEFDMEFLQAMITGHKEAIQMFENQTQTGKNADVIDYARRQLPGLQDHLRQAETLKGKLPN